LSIEHHAKEWKQTLGDFLLSSVVEAMNELKAQIEALRIEVELVITGLTRFMSIMQAITDVKGMAVQTEVKFLSYQESFKTMRVHEVTFPLSAEEMAYELQRNWESLYLGALYRASTLESTSERFSELTQEEIEQYLAEIAKFAEEFEMHGPGSIGDRFDEGLEKMEVKYLKRMLFIDMPLNLSRRNERSFDQALLNSSSMTNVFFHESQIVNVIIFISRFRFHFADIRQTDPCVRRETFELD